MMRFFDSLTSFVAGLGTSRDKAATTEYLATNVSDAELVNAYRSAWLPRKIVDIPAFDSCREWRLWRGDEAWIEKMENEEKRLQLRRKVIEARVKARLFGGAAIYFDTGQPPSEPLNVAAVRAGGLRFLTVLAARTQITAGEVEDDALSENFGKPRYYEVKGGTSGQMRVDPSRLAVFHGAPRIDNGLIGVNDGWGDSVLLSVFNAIKQADGTSANIASLIFEAKIDIITMEGLTDYLDGGPLEEKVKNRYALAAMMKGINGTMVLDGKEKYDQKSASFQTLPDIMDRFFQNVSGAADIPMTRLFGQSPGGLNASGESDLRNYYDRIASGQELEMTPALVLLDNTLTMSALGQLPTDLYYEWAPLWQLSDREKAEILKLKADAARVIVGSGGTSEPIIPIEAMSDALVSALIEDGSLPALETAIEEYGTLAEQEEDDGDEAAAALSPPVAVLPAPVTDARPMTLYIRRDVLNTADIVAWAKSVGFDSVQDDLHVTVVHTRTPLDWIKIGQANEWGDNEGGKLTIAAGGPRLVERFNDAVVLQFASSRLAWRFEDIVRLGAEVDYPEYQPHITISWNAPNIDVRAIEPYRGRILLGPEVFEEVDDNWKARTDA